MEADDQSGNERTNNVTGDSIEQQPCRLCGKARVFRPKRNPMKKEDFHSIIKQIVGKKIFCLKYCSTEFILKHLCQLAVFFACHDI